MVVKRGNIVSIVQPGAYGKPRPGLLIQSDLFDRHPSVTVLPITSTLRDTPLFRLRIDPSAENGLNVVSEIMIDKITTIPRNKVGDIFGRLENHHLIAAERLMAVFLGFA
ncbi:MAG: type II toxin-antitoxin system PemK/MazF family toxin [Thermodesulfobacteriota bacterium]|nr:type II toxin-antitoxin system PemK/MazF family toxin [Thermodesulfobacteriota bacterium]